MAKKTKPKKKTAPPPVKKTPEPKQSAGRIAHEKDKARDAAKENRR